MFGNYVVLIIVML